MPLRANAIASLNVTDRYDNILPNLAERLKAQFIQASPNFQNQISAAVDEQALAPPRRADLEKEAATIYAKGFSVDELKSISTSSTRTGKKPPTNQPLVSRELTKAARGLGKRDFPRPDQPELEKRAASSTQPDQAAGRRSGSGGSTGCCTCSGKARHAAGQACCRACGQACCSGRDRSSQAAAPAAAGPGLAPAPKP